MQKGSGALIRLLAIFSALAIVLITVLLVAFGYSEAAFGADVFWDSFATIINAWMPYYSDGDCSIVYLIVMAVAAIIGLLITSVLIGIISNAIEEHMDYVVASNMSSLFLAQLCENYELDWLYKEILASWGNELYLKKAKDFGCDGTYTTVQLRNLTLSNNCVLLGYLRAETYESFFNPGLTEEIQLNAEDSLIVLSEN
jgi:hypothetical protein